MLHPLRSSDELTPWTLSQQASSSYTSTVQDGTHPAPHCISRRYMLKMKVNRIYDTIGPAETPFVASYRS
jgi:hypothetical protein